MNKNPFNIGKPVKGEDFYNRKEEIGRIVDSIRGMQCFSIVGERRIGKTSVLEHVLSKEFLMEYDLDLNKYIIVYFSMAELHEITKQTIVENLVKKLEQYIQIGKKSTDIFENLIALVDELGSNGKKVIIAVDEFELITHILDDHFSFWLRNILQKPNIMAITASRTTIRALSDDKPASPLYNIFMNITLGLFSRRETEEMIIEMFQKGGKKLNKDEISFLSDLSGGNPYLIQLIGYYYYEERKRDKEAPQQEFKNKVLNQLRDIFEGYWDHLSEKEKIVLYNYKKIKKDQVSYNLQKKGFLIDESGELKIFSSLFCKFIKTKIPQSDSEFDEKTKDSTSSFSEESYFDIKNSTIWKFSVKNILEAVIAAVIAGIILLLIT